MLLKIFKEYVCIIDQHASENRFCGKIYTGMLAKEILSIEINALQVVSTQKCMWNEYKRKMVRFEDATLLPLCEVKTSSCVTAAGTIIWYLRVNRELLLKNRGV